MPTLARELDDALKAMETGWNVRLIATLPPDVVFAPADVEAATWLSTANPSFDQFPVRDGHETIGVLVRNGEYGNRRVRDAMRPLSEALVVSADMPIIKLISELRRNHFRLVLRGTRVDGLVTQSDLLKLPARQLLFGLITHLELCLRAVIRDRIHGEEWVGMLPERRRNYIEGCLRKLTNLRLDPDPLEVTNFSDVIEVVRQIGGFGENFSHDMRSIRTLRNAIAHANTFVSSKHDVELFVRTFDGLCYWLDRITEEVES